MDDPENIYRLSDAMDKLRGAAKEVSKETLGASVSAEELKEILEKYLGEHQSNPVITMGNSHSFERVDSNPPRREDITDEEVQKYNHKALIKCEHGLYEMTCPHCNKGELRKCKECDDYTYPDKHFGRICEDVCGECGVHYPERIPDRRELYFGHYIEGGVSLDSDPLGWTFVGGMVDFSVDQAMDALNKPRHSFGTTEKKSHKLSDRFKRFLGLECD